MLRLTTEGVNKMAEPIDYTNKLDKTLTIVRNLQTVTEQLMSAIEKYVELRSQINANGINFEDYNMQYAEQDGLRHVDGATINSSIGQFQAIVDYLNTGYNKDPLNKFRTGA
jgi:SMC interacting uncharacterized protein involved in chromosome segregation